MAQAGSIDSSMVNVYTSANPLRIANNNKGIAAEIRIDSPPGAARSQSAGKRVEYWRAASRKRLMQGGLVAVVWESAASLDIFFGLITSSSDDIIDSTRRDKASLTVRVKFFDPTVNLRVMDWCEEGAQSKRRDKIMMIEASVMYESIRPFLEALQREPTAVPFQRLLVHGEHQRTPGLPGYVVAKQDFVWDLDCLVQPSPFKLTMNPRDRFSVLQARERLRNRSKLDRSQADAMIDCLTKEFCLIQGPPGTGKVCSSSTW